MSTTPSLPMSHPPARTSRPCSSGCAQCARNTRSGKIATGSGMYSGTLTSRPSPGDPAAFSSDTARLVPAGAPVRRGMLTQLDPPEHRALRHLVSAAFTPRTVAALEPRIRTVTGELLDATGERFDLVDALAFPLPVIVIAELLGLPTEDRELFRTWADGLFSIQVDDPSDPELGAKVAAAMADITTYLTGHCRSTTRPSRVPAGCGTTSGASSAPGTCPCTPSQR